MFPAVTKTFVGFENFFQAGERNGETMVKKKKEEEDRPCTPEITLFTITVAVCFKSYLNGKRERVKQLSG